MALYEFVLRFPDRPDEIRVGDCEAGVGDPLLIAGRRWIVVARVDCNGHTAARFFLDPSTRTLNGADASRELVLGRSRALRSSL